MFRELDNRVVLGVGKPVRLLNAIYEHAKCHPEVRLTIVTALTLTEEGSSSALGRRLSDPILRRLSGGGPEPCWRADQVAGQIPPNIDVRDFYLTPGRSTNVRAAQQAHISANYHHVAQLLAEMGTNAIVQLVSPERNGQISLGTNPDVSLRVLDYLDGRRSAGESVTKIAEMAEEMPRLGGEALVDSDLFDVLVDNDEPTPLFGIPNPPVDQTDAAIGILAAALIKDGGTLQLGIGSLGDAVAAGIELRQSDSGRFHEIVEELSSPAALNLIDDWGGTSEFEDGVYVASEMLSDSLLNLEEAGIVSRRVSVDPVVQSALNDVGGRPGIGLLKRLHSLGIIDDPLGGTDVMRLIEAGVFDSTISFRGGDLRDAREQLIDPSIGEHLESIINAELAGPAIHAAFAAGSPDFYERLRQRVEHLPLEMVDVGFTNTLLGNESLKRAQRRHARFVNATMQGTCLGGAASDTLEDGRVVSGVGGQHDFVTQAHDLEGARSVIVVRATRSESGKNVSNIVWEHGHPTIPRHLRDIVVSEYGIADLRGRSDAETVAAMIEIADARFQHGLVARAKDVGKLHSSYEIPARARNNRPERIAHAMRAEPVPRYPFGSVLTQVEDDLRQALSGLEQIGADPRSWPEFRSVRKALGPTPSRYVEHLRRLELASPRSWKERLMASVVVAALEESGVKDE